VKSIPTKKPSKRPSVSALRIPIYHRRRRDWRDDQYLIEEIVKHLQTDHGKKANTAGKIKEFIDLASQIEDLGYQSNSKALTLAMWIREQLAELSRNHGGYDLQVHALLLPAGLDEIISNRCKQLQLTDPVPPLQVSIEELFPDPEIRAHALQRVQLLHKGDLHSYLHALVSKERDSLTGNSATIMDLIHICSQKLGRRNLRVVSNYNANEVDFWIPGLSLGIEVRDALSPNDCEDLLPILQNTNSSKKTRFLAVVCPDDLSDLMFHQWREIEKSDNLSNLSVIRIGDLGVYLDKLTEMMKEG